jgi:hypothetical protein
MARKTKKQSRKVSGAGASAVASKEEVKLDSKATTGLASRSYSTEFNPDYSQTKKDLRRIAILASSFFAILVIISFFLR